MKILKLFSALFFCVAFVFFVISFFNGNSDSMYQIIAFMALGSGSVTNLIILLSGKK